MDQNIHSTSSGAMAPATAPPPLPNDILVEIFLFLPAKSVLRFRAVCKPWRLLLSDPVFIREHHRRAPRTILLNNPYIVNGDAISALPFPYTDQSTAAPLYCGITCQPTYLRGCCDGLLLFSCSRVRTDELDAAGSSYRYFVCNPATRELASLPADLGSVGVLGFYRHAPTAEYRVLCYSYKSSSPSHYEYLVATPGQLRARKLDPTDLWKTRDYIVWMLNGAPAIHRGCLHWMAWLRSKGTVVFDTISEEFRHMRGPVDGDARMDDMPGRLVGLDDGTLGASMFVASERALKVWVLESYEEEEWAFRYNIDVGFLGSKFPLHSVTIAHVSDEGDAVLMTFRGKRYGVYSLRRGQVVSTSQEPFLGHLRGTNHVYQASLVWCGSKSPKGVGDHHRST